MSNFLKTGFLILVVILSFAWMLKISEEREGLRPREEREDRTGAMAALDFWTRARAYPAADIPAGKYYRSYVEAKARHKDLGAAVNTAAIWNPIGPLNLQGRALSVAINPLNPSTVYLGSASGGLWRSNNGGLGGDWQQVITGYPVRGVGSIAINPVDTNVMYIGSGEVYQYQEAIGGQVIRTTRGSYGIGILKTTDGGLTWSLSLDWSLSLQSGVEKIVLNPRNPNTIYAGTSEGLYKSYDAGATWVLSFQALLVEDILVNPLDTNMVLISCGDFKSQMYGVYRSQNGGDNWGFVSGFPDYAGKALLEMYAKNPTTVYASVGIDSVTDHGMLLRSTDFGNNWSLVYDHNGDGLFQVQGWYSHYVAVNPVDSTQIIQAAVPISKSINGGASFFAANGEYSDNHGFAHHPTNPNIIFSACDDGIYRSTDFGSTWSNVGYGLITGQLYNGFSSSWQDSTLAIGQSQDHIPGYRYLGSLTWDHASASDEAGWTGINPTDDHYVYAVNRYGGAMFRSTDRGSTFPYGVGFDNSGAWNSPMVISSASPNAIYFGDIHIHRSADAGSSFSVTNGGVPLDGNPVLSLAVGSRGTLGNDTVYAGTAPIVTTAHLFRSTNGGTSWTNITGSLPDRYPLDIAVDPSDARRVYVAFGGFGGNHFFKSTDAGTTWNDISGSLPDVPTTAALVDPLHTNIVYAGNDLGVYVSTDAGTTWSGFSQGLPDGVIVADLSLSPSNRMLRAVTHGNGVFERKMYGEFPANYFDYKVLSISTPTPGRVDLVGTPMTPVASFRSLSTQAQSDSFNVEFRILSGSTEVYAVTKRIPGLGVGETRQVNFGVPFTADSAGVFTTQAISAAGDQDPTNDTISGTYTVVLAPDIYVFDVEKGSCPYTEITGGSAGPAGDDAVLAVGIPFLFTYDSHVYDSVQISTNGWAELGTGPRGSLFGLSTLDQLTAYFTPTLGTTDRPTKAIGPWWADLNSSGGQITYATLGSAPNRVFVIQWKNVLSNYDAGLTSARLNFQVRLNETTNILDIYYGTVVPGSSPGSPASASMGIKDNVGGDYRFYDLFARGTGPASSLVSSLNPLSNWPGPDSCFHIQTNPTGVVVALSQGWNMVSNPALRADNFVGDLFPGAGTAAFSFNNGYQVADSIVPALGYWINMSLASSPRIGGASLPSVNVPVSAGWNMIGGPDHAVPAPSGGIVTGNVFGYSSGGYAVATTLQPGYGYWVRTTSAGTIPLGPMSAAGPAARTAEEFSQIVIADKTGRKQTLYLAQDDNGTVDPGAYLLPPSPPPGAFDVRFTGGSMLAAYGSDLTGDLVRPLQIHGAAPPLSIAWTIRPGGGKPVYLDESANGTIIGSHRLTGGGKMVISGGAGTTLALRVGASGTAPASFALRQNYPNPFNPSTTISFDVPRKTSLRLVVYDLLGREVFTAAEGVFEQGSYSVHADLSGRASGIYLYRLLAGDFSETKKMVVTK